MRKLADSLVAVACVAYVALAALTIATASPGAATTNQVVADATGVVRSVDPTSAAWLNGVRPGWLVVGADDNNTYYQDALGDIRPVARSSGERKVPIGDLVPAAAALVAAAVLVALRLRRTGLTLAVAGAAAASPIFASRVLPVGPLIGLAPVAMSAGLVAVFGSQLGVRPDPAQGPGTIARRLVLPFVVLPLGLMLVAQLAGGVIAAAWIGAAAYIVLAWALVTMWRTRVAAARLGQSGNSGNVRRATAVARSVLTDMLPFSDRFIRRGAETERERLAGDLHAEILPAIAMTASELERRGALAEAEHVRGLATSVRELVSARRLPILDDEGLVPATEWLAETVQNRTDIRVEIALDGWDGSRQPPKVERAAYRVVQLALDNVVRHSGAAAASVAIGGDARSLVLSIEDAGVGIGRGSATRDTRSHLGIIDMQAETDSIGATLAVEEVSPNGTRVSLRWRA